MDPARHGEHLIPRGLFPTLGAFAARPARARRMRAWHALAFVALAVGPALPACAQSAPANAPGPGASAATRGVAAVTRPATLDDLDAWLRYKVRARQAALPAEARLFYRQGLVAKQSGTFEDAVRLVRGAAELDPGYADPQLALCSWYLFREPGQALLQCASLFELARQSFVFQLGLAANGAYLLVHSLFVALLAAGLLSVAIRNPELRHPIQEFLARRRLKTARLWPWVFLAVPYAAGLGIALPTVFFLALLWPVSKTRERLLFVTMIAILFAAPWLASQVTRVTTPIAGDAAPFYGVATLPGEPATPERRERLAALAARHPRDPFLTFGLGWLARQAGDLAAAEQHYREAMRVAPGNDRVMNNLANVLTLQGRTDEALELYRRAIEANAGNAAAHFNSAQIHTQRFDYRAASEALSHASALEFEMVKSQQAVTADGHVPLVDQWIAPADFWRALRDHPASAGGRDALPPMWRERIEFSGAPFLLALVVTLAAGLLLGAWRQKAVPLRRCSNCDAVVCRRCAQRRRELALCRPCAAIEARAQAAEFSRVLLAEQRRKAQRPVRLARTALATLVPGFGLLAFRRVGTAVFLLAVSTALVTVWSEHATPFRYGLRVLSFDREIPVAAALAPWTIVYAWSVLAYFAEQSRHDARAAATPRGARGRPGPTRPTAAAA